MKRVSLIFDLDGTLVDSEPLNIQAFRDLLPELKRKMPDISDRYVGWKLAKILEDIESQIETTLASDFEARYRKRVCELYETELKSIPGVASVLHRLSNVKSVASSAPRAKIEHALRITELSAHFGSRIYSSYEVGSWKPDPGIFLHAARGLGASPLSCVVIEDSAVGVQAALSAGMRVLQYCPAGSSNADPGCLRFSAMSELPELIGQIERAI